MMRLARLVLPALLLYCPAHGADSRNVAEDKFLIARPSPQWLKTYSLSPYKEFWTLRVEVPSLEKDRPKILNIFSKAGARLIQPLESFPSSKIDKTQQLSFKLGLKAAKAALKRLRKVGSFLEPATRPSAEPVPIPEVKDKIQRLISEKTAHAKELASMPAVSAVVDELLEQLLMVEVVQGKTDTEVLLNMTIQERR